MKQKLALLVVLSLAVAFTLLMLAPQTSGAFQSSPPPPQPLEVTVNPTGSVDSHTGSATVSGLLTCNGTFDYINLSLTVRQKQGRSIAEGGGYVSLPQGCSWQNVPWSVTIRADRAYKGGPAEVLTYWGGCSYYPYYNCFNASSVTSVQLNGSPK